jgi:Family of unknown function (DUF6022)
MQTLEVFLEQHASPTLHVLGDYARLHVTEQWQHVLQSQQEKLQELFDKVGEGAAYGTYAQQLFKPIGNQLKISGFSSTPSFPGTLATSLEWGGLKNRERWMWSVIEGARGTTLGTLVVCLFHDHTTFRLPQAPSVLALTESYESSIVKAISKASGYSAKDAA